ncbi:MAG: mechanosensitive ion channel domain-containing protein, partial [Pseudomonadota bacterium]
LLFGVRRRIVGWVEAFLNQNSARKASSWAGAVLNLARLLVPAVGVAALISGIEALALFGVAGRALIGGLPEAATVLILAYWVGHSVFAPQITRYRLIRLEDADARTGARWTFVLGALTGLYLLLGVVLEQQQAPAEVTVVLGFPVLLFAALALWRLAALFRKALKAPEPTNQDGEPAPEPFGLNMIRLLRRFSVLVALLSPVLAAIGYAALSEYLLFSLILSLGLLGGAFVVFTTFLRVLDALMRPPSEDASAAGDPFGLLPVFGGFVIVLVCLPILALIWGARQSDILEVWVWLRDGISIGGSRISLTDFLVFVLVFGIGYTLTRFIQSVLRRTVMPRTRLDVGGQNAVTTGVGYLGIFLAAVVAITATGLDLSNLAIVAGALSVGVGFGLQTIVSNFVSGIILLIERPIKQGDWIEVAGYSGYVRKISVRSTEIETFDRSNVIVPNQELIAGSVLNFTHGSMNGRVIVPVGVAYGTDARKVEAILREIAEAHPLVLRRPPPAVIFMGFGADSLDFEIRAILRDVNYMLSVKSDMNFDIYKRFTEEGIEIPFAQRDINIRNPEGIASVLRGAASKEA